MPRADLRTPSTLLMIRCVGTSHATHTPAHDIIHMSSGNSVFMDQYGESQLGSLPVAGIQSIDVASGPSSFVHTGAACVLRSVFRQMVFIEKNSSAETMYELVSPDNEASVICMTAGSAVQVKEGDVMVMMTCTIDHYNFDPNRIAAVVVALPALSVSVLDTLRPRLTAIYNRVKGFLACHAYNALKFTMDARLYADYRQNMGMDMQAMNQVCVMDFPRSYFGLEEESEEPNHLKRAASSDADTGVQKKRKTVPVSNKRVLSDEPLGRRTRARS